MWRLWADRGPAAGGWQHWSLSELPGLEEPTANRCLTITSVWPDGFIAIQSMANYNNDNLPSSIKMPKSRQKFAKY